MRKPSQNLTQAVTSLTFVFAAFWASDLAAYRNVTPKDRERTVTKTPVPEQKRSVPAQIIERTPAVMPNLLTPRSIPVPMPVTTVHISRPAAAQAAPEVTPARRASGLPQSLPPIPPARVKGLNRQVEIAALGATGAQITENNPDLVRNRSKAQDNFDAPEQTQIMGLDINRSDVYRTFADPNSPVPPSVEFNIPHLPQEEPLWCWAAAAQQAIGWVNNGKAPAQCAIVALAHGIDVKKCCNDRKGICAKTGEIPAISRLVQKYGGVAYKITVPKRPTDIYDRLVAGKTMLIRLKPTPEEDAVGIRHMIMVRGIQWYRLPNGKLQANLFYNDPLGANARMVDFHDIVGFFEEAMLISRN